MGARIQKGTVFKCVGDVGYNLEMQITAIIFDLDGTVIDNEQLWEEAFVKVAQSKGFAKPKLVMENGWWHEPGLGLSANWRRLVSDSENKIVDAIEKLVGLTVKEYNDLRLSVSLRDGVEEAVAIAKERKWQTGLCTGSTWSIVEKELEEMSMQLAFDVTITGEEVYISKPDPEIYLLAMQKLGIEPAEGLVVEDAIAGIRSAKEAGLKVIGLVSGYATKEMMQAAGADYVASDFADVIELFKTIE